ncbi:thioredoxin-like protein [Xylariaceae sp. FL0594]|nr:thioredoxin-like protein [Xylariaceae sp. FL0594]
MSFRTATQNTLLRRSAFSQALNSNPRLFSPFSSPSPLPLRQFHTTLPKMTVHNIATEAEFEETVKKYPVVLVDAFATWCGPCKAIAPTIAKFSNEEQFKDVHFVKIDVDELAELSQKLGITAMPTFVLYKNGEYSDKVVGAKREEIENLLLSTV